MEFRTRIAHPPRARPASRHRRCWVSSYHGGIESSSSSSGPAICPVVRRHPAHSIESSRASVRKGRPVDRLADLVTVREKDEVTLTFKLVQRRVGEQLR